MYEILKTGIYSKRVGSCCKPGIASVDTRCQYVAVILIPYFGIYTCVIGDHEQILTGKIEAKFFKHA